jgi:glycosyltransferase involved in cell wall biosynthesis
MKRSKRICVCSAQIPFVYGGTEILMDELIKRLRDRGYPTELIRLPLQTQPHEELLKSCLAWRLINLDFVELETIDLVICSRFPSYLAPHSNKVVWLNHQYRQIYDWYETPFSDFQLTTRDNEIRKSLIELDQISFAESKKIFSQSRTVAERLSRYNNFESELLFAPIGDSEAFRFETLEDFILCVSRLSGNKRVHLLIEAMKYVPPRFRAVIVGEGYARKELQELVSKLGLEERIHFTGHVSREEVIRNYANAGAVFYGPLNEDYGLATMESFYASKPVITCTDSGGVLEFVNDSNGWIVEANPEQIGNAIETALTQKEQARAKGNAGRESISFLNWDYTLDRLLETMDRRL